MKIDSSNNGTPAIHQLAAPRGNGNVEAPEAVDAVQPASSTVSLSSMSTARTTNGADIDTAKVESIKAALRDGSYKIDPSKIADGMLSDARGLLQTKAR